MPDSEPKVKAFRFTDEELEVLGIIEGQTGIRSRTEALRGVLKEHARPAPSPDKGDPAATPEAATPEEAAKTTKPPQ